MKKIITLTTLFIIIGCSAQSPIINIANNHSMVEGIYNKDVNNLLNPFEGNYLFTNTSTNTTLEIRLVKTIMDFNGKYYEDLIIGEYEYKVGGITIISTLSNLNVQYTFQREHGIGGNCILKKNNRPICNDCTTSEKRLLIGFNDPTTPLFGTVLIRRITQNGLPAIKVFITSTGGNTYLEGTPAPTSFKIPEGEYILMKI
jgi:hypothetical protein